MKNARALLPFVDVSLTGRSRAFVTCPNKFRSINSKLALKLNLALIAAYLTISCCLQVQYANEVVDFDARYVIGLNC